MFTIHYVVKLAGVAPITVSRALNKSGYVSQTTRKRIEVAIEEFDNDDHTGIKRYQDSSLIERTEDLSG